MKKEKQVENADKLVADGKYDKALKAYQKVINANPDDMRLKIKLGDLYVKRKEVPLAITTYQEVADAYVKERFHLKAIAIYKMVLKLNPTMISINEKLGDLYREVGLQKDALSQYFIVADHFEQMGQGDNVLEVRRKIVETDPNAVTSRIRLAETYQKEGQSNDSLREYERAAHDLEERQDVDGMIEVYERILYHRPEEYNRIVDLCRLYMQKGETAKAEERINSLKPDVMEKPVVMAVAIDIFLKLEQREKVRRIMRSLYEFHASQGDSDSAWKLYARAREEFSDDIEYLDELEAMRKEAGLQDTPQPSAESAEEPQQGMKVTSESAPVRDEDLEKTTMVRLDDLPPVEPEAKPQAKKDESIDLDKTVMVRADELEPPKPKPEPAKTKPAKPKKDEPANLDETVMVSVDELEKQFKNKQKS